jgi:hypothetical protein
VGFLLDAPPSLNTWLSMYHHAKAPNVLFSITPEWLDDLNTKISLVKSLDMLPKYSIFNDNALSKNLDEFRKSNDLSNLQEFMDQAIQRQMILRGQTEKNAGDVFDLGLPVDRYYVPAPLATIMPLPELSANDSSAGPTDDNNVSASIDSISESFQP